MNVPPDAGRMSMAGTEAHRPTERSIADVVDIVDVVLGVSTPGPRGVVVMAAGATVAACALLGLWALHLDRRPASAPALAAELPLEISLEEAADRTRPSPAPPARPQLVPPPRQPVARHTSPRPDARAPGGPSAQAASVVAREPSGPVDLTGETLVVGAANVYGGGATERNGASASPAGGKGAARGSSAGSASAEGARAPSQSAPVGLASQSWSCPWPADAEPLPIDEETVVIRVVVRPDGSAESVAVVSDPGHGFGAAAASCAMRTRFTPARAAGGEPLRASSPPIRVRFTR
jgi:protein TonB